MPIFPNNHWPNHKKNNTAEISETFSINPYKTYHRIVRIQTVPQNMMCYHF